MKDKMTRLIKKLSPLSLPIFFLALVFLDCVFRWVYAQAGSTRLLSWKPMLFTAGWALLLTSLTALLPRRLRRIAMGALGALFGFLTVLHGVMFNIFGHFFSFSDMNFAGDGAKFFSWTYLRLPKKMYFFVFLFLLLVAASIVLVPRPKLSGKKLWIRRACALLGVPLSLAAIGFTHQRLMPKENTVLTWDTVYDPNTLVYESFSDANRSMKLTGLYQYTARNLAITLGWGVDKASTEELDSYFEERAAQISGDNDFTGRFQGKNLIMIMMESMDTWMARPEYMPNLCRLQAEGVNFENFYTPLFLSAGTFNTEIISQTGMIPPVTGTPASVYSTNSFPLSLAHLFAGEGYTVNSFHSASPAIYSRGTVHANLGFEKYHSYVDMGMDDYQLDSQMIRAYDLMAPEEKFFSFIITYSGHGPYTEEMGNIAAPHLEKARAAVAASGVSGSEENMSEYTRAIAHAMETDQFIGELVDRLEQEGRLEDTVLLLYADHYGKYMTDKDFLSSVKGAAGEPELYRTPCILYGGGIEKMVVDKCCSSIDLAPTVVNLFALPNERKYYAGDDIFGETPGAVIFPNGAWYSDGVWFNGEGAGPDPERTAALKRRADESMEAIRCDYFKGKNQ